jgi:hypothetical protein
LPADAELYVGSFYTWGKALQHRMPAYQTQASPRYKEAHPLYASTFSGGGPQVCGFGSIDRVRASI